jgi:hypothetical protein
MSVHGMSERRACKAIGSCRMTSQWRMLSSSLSSLAGRAPLQDPALDTGTGPDWRTDYNGSRPYPRLSRHTPSAFASNFDQELPSLDPPPNTPIPTPERTHRWIKLGGNVDSQTTENCREKRMSCCPMIGCARGSGACGRSNDRYAEIS